MKKFLSFAFDKLSHVPRSNPSESTHHNDADRHWLEDYMNASSDIDAVCYYERRLWET